MTNPTSKIKYLTNKDLLEEIHKSKKTYCVFLSEEYGDYDIIVSNLENVTPERIEQARKKRYDTYVSKAKKEATSRGIKNFQPTITIESIDPESIVIRLMTFDHIPINHEKLHKAKTESERHIKCNFPPFQHFIYKDNDFVCVGKSHWFGGLENGYFSNSHGTITSRLALMFMKLVERYSLRGNWRGYCIDTDTEALTQRGWLGIDEITESDIILSYDQGDLKWSPIHSIYRDHYEGLMHKLTVRGMDALITPNHKLVTTRGLVKAEHLLESDRVVLMGNAVDSNLKTHNDSLVELAGWIITEGCYESNEKGIKRITVYQNTGPKADRIRNCLTTLGFKFSESAPRNKNIAFSISRANSKSLAELLPNKNLTMDFILSLTTDQKHLLINTMIDGDGWRVGDNRRYVQKSKDGIDMFQILCTLAGIKTNTHFIENHKSFGKNTNYYQVNLFSPRGNTTRGECINFHGGKRNGRKHVGRGKDTHPNEPTTYYNGMVWCPETDYGCFVARRNGKVYLTGNTYNDEMRSQALLQLSQMGLQFDESKSDTPNPFAYYCVSEDDEAFTQRGWLGINEITEDDIILSYEEGNLKWSKILSIYRGYYEGKMHQLTGDGLDALVTPGHKMVTTRGLVKMEDLLPNDHIILMGNSNLDNQNMNKYKTIPVTDIDFHGGNLNNKIEPTTSYAGMVWCPETEYGCFVVKRNDEIYLTGNTAAVNNSFTRILNLEKRSQNIRDDLLIMHGAMPSYTRQTEQDLQKGTTTVAAKGRGRFGKKAAPKE